MYQPCTSQILHHTAGVEHLQSRRSANLRFENCTHFEYNCSRNENSAHQCWRSALRPEPGESSGASLWRARQELLRASVSPFGLKETHAALINKPQWSPIPSSFLISMGDNTRTGLSSHSPIACLPASTRAAQRGAVHCCFLLLCPLPELDSQFGAQTQSTDARHQTVLRTKDRWSRFLYPISLAGRGQLDWTAIS